MRRLASGAALILVTATLTGTAHAGSAPRNCGHLVTDPRGDAYMWFLPTRPYNPQADLLSLDAVTTRSNIDFTVAMASVQQMPVTGTNITIYFTVGQQGKTVDYYVNIYHEVDGTSFSVENVATSQATTIAGSVNPGSSTFVAHVPRSAIGARVGGVLLHGLGLVVGQTVGIALANSGFVEQSTSPNHQYRVGYPYGCPRHPKSSSK